MQTFRYILLTNLVVHYINIINIVYMQPNLLIKCTQTVAFSSNLTSFHVKSSIHSCISSLESAYRKNVLFGKTKLRENKMIPSCYHSCQLIPSILSKTDNFGTGTRCQSYRESNKGSKQRQGSTKSRCPL